MNSRLRLALLLVAVPTMLVGIACGDDDDDNDGDNTPVATSSPTVDASPTDDGPDDEGDAAEAEVEAAVEAFVAAYNAGDAEGFFAAMTDAGAQAFLENFFGPIEDLEAAKAEAAAGGFLGGSPLDVRDMDVEVEGDTATVELESQTDAIIEGDRLTMVNDGGTWKIDLLELYAVSPEIEDGYTTVDVDLVDFGFVMDTEPLEAGQIAFVLDNVGAQPHEAVLVGLAEDVVLEEALQSEGEPEGVTFIGVVAPLAEGDQYNMVVVDEMEAGRYAFLCFFPDVEDPEGTPHFVKGMVREFTVE